MSSYTQEEQQLAYKKNAQLSIQLLVQILKIVNIASSRGSFNGSELSDIGAVYDKINLGVESAMKSARNELQNRIGKDAPIQNIDNTNYMQNIPAIKQYQNTQHSQQINQPSQQPDLPPELRPTETRVSKTLLQ